MAKVYTNEPVDGIRKEFNPRKAFKGSEMEWWNNLSHRERAMEPRTFCS